MPSRIDNPSKKPGCRFRADVYMPSERHVALAHAVVELTKRGLDWSVLEPSFIALLGRSEGAGELISQVIDVLRNGTAANNSKQTAQVFPGASGATLLSQGEDPDSLRPIDFGSSEDADSVRQDSKPIRSGPPSVDREPTAWFWLLVAFLLVFLFLATLGLLRWWSL